MSELLQRLGPIPRTIVHLDFETYYSSDYSLSKLTTEAYVRDERFEVIGVGVRAGRDAKTVWLEEWEFAEWAGSFDWRTVSVNANHAQFDGFILSERYGIRPGFWFDTMYLGRILTGRGALDPLAQHFGVGRKGDAIESHRYRGKRRADFTQAQWLDYGRYCRNDVDLAADVLRKMAPTFPREELWLIDTTLRMFTEPVFRADLDLLRRTLEAERTRKREVLQGLVTRYVDPARVNTDDPIEAMRAVLASSEKFAYLLRRLGQAAPTKLNNKGEGIYAFAKTDPGMTAMLESDRDEIRFLAEARLQVKSTLVETRTERLLGIGQRGLVPIYLKYAGAHTHRWSGGDKMNPQNFNRGGALRDALIVNEEEEIVVADSAQIEARVLPWLAGETSLIATFQRNDSTGGDFYSDVGGDYFRMKLSKKETPVERQLAKNMVLGLGFEMGWAKFSANLLLGMLGSAPIQFTIDDVRKYGIDLSAFLNRSQEINGEWKTNRERIEAMIDAGAIRIPYQGAAIHCSVADYFVRVYRQRNARISKFWRVAEKLLVAMENPEGDPYAVRLRYRGLEVMRHAVRKPNGLVLRYPGLARHRGQFSYMGGKSGRERVSIYGGAFTENLVQSLARDIVAEQALRVRADGHRIATTTHDEIVVVTRRGNGAAVLSSMIAHMRTPPAWCSDLPLNAEGGVGTRYGDAK